MIIKGKSRSGARALAAHLGNAEKNERVTLLETKGVISKDLRGALVEMDALALGTKSTKSMYHAAMSPEPPHRLSDAQRIEAIDSLEEKLGLTGHARVVVMHEKLGRQHIHIVWSRVDLAKMQVVSDSHNYRKHEEVARDLERRFGHDRVQGAHHERDGKERPDRTPSRAELRQEERTGIKGKSVAEDVRAAFTSSDNAQAFMVALWQKKYILAHGDRRDFVVIDRKGGIHSLARRIGSLKAAELRKYMAGIDPKKLPSIEAAKLVAAKLHDKEQKQRKSSKSEKKTYAGGLDYVTQSTAALKDAQKRQEKLDKKQNDAVRTFDYGKPKADRSPKELSDKKQRRQDHERNSEKDDRRQRRDHTDSDRQPRAPGGGRTRSR